MLQLFLYCSYCPFDPFSKGKVVIVGLVIASTGIRYHVSTCSKYAANMSISHAKAGLGCLLFLFAPTQNSSANSALILKPLANPSGRVLTPLIWTRIDLWLLLYTILS